MALLWPSFWSLLRRDLSVTIESMSAKSDSRMASVRSMSSSSSSSNSSGTDFLRTAWLGNDRFIDCAWLPRTVICIADGMAASGLSSRKADDDIPGFKVANFSVPAKERVELAFVRNCKTSNPTYVVTCDVAVDELLRLCDFCREHYVLTVGELRSAGKRSEPYVYSILRKELYPILQKCIFRPSDVSASKYTKTGFFWKYAGADSLTKPKVALICTATECLSFSALAG